MLLKNSYHVEIEDKRSQGCERGLTPNSVTKTSLSRPPFSFLSRSFCIEQLFIIAPFWILLLMPYFSIISNFEVIVGSQGFIPLETLATSPAKLSQVHVQNFLLAKLISQVTRMAICERQVKIGAVKFLFTEEIFLLFVIYLCKMIPRNEIGQFSVLTIKTSPMST